MSAQLSLFEAPPDLPEGMVYRSDLLSAAEEASLIGRLAELPFRAFQFHGFEGNRRTVSFGFHYGFDGSGLRETEPMPEWLLPIRGRAASPSRATMPCGTAITHEGT